MGPKRVESLPQEELFRSHLENMISLDHELVKLSRLIDWEALDAEWGKLFVSDRGAPAIATRLIAGLHYLKHMHKLSDEEVLNRWVENPYWQYFCGEEWFRHELPIHPNSQWRDRYIDGWRAGLADDEIGDGNAGHILGLVHPLPAGCRDIQRLDTTE